MFVIGFVGGNGSGKGTAVGFLKKALPQKRIAHINFSLPLIETIKLWQEGVSVIPKTFALWGLDPQNEKDTVLLESIIRERHPHFVINRETLQWLAAKLNKTWGEGTLSRIVKARCLAEEKARTDIVALDGVRLWSDYEMIRSFEKNLLIYILADPVRRFRRLRDRGERPGERDLTWPRFQKEEEAPTEVTISAIGKKADFRLVNHEDDLDLFERTFTNLFENHLKPILNA